MSRGELITGPITFIRDGGDVVGVIAQTGGAAQGQQSQGSSNSTLTDIGQSPPPTGPGVKTGVPPVTPTNIIVPQYSVARIQFKAVPLVLGESGAYASGDSDTVYASGAWKNFLDGWAITALGAWDYTYLAKRAAVGPDKFIVADANQLYITTDLVVWTPYDVPVIANFLSIQNIWYWAGTYVLQLRLTNGTHATYTSSDALAWNYVSTFNGNFNNPVTFNTKGYYFGSGRCYWYDSYNPTDTQYIVSYPDRDLYSTYADKYLLFKGKLINTFYNFNSGNSTYNYFSVSVDTAHNVVNSTAFATSSNDFYSQSSFAASADLAMLITGTYRVFTTSDGINWAEQTPNVSLTNADYLTCVNGVFVLVLHDATTTVVKTSTDGITWVAEDILTASAFTRNGTLALSFAGSAILYDVETGKIATKPM